MNKRHLRTAGKPIPFIPPPPCYQNQYLKYPEVCGFVCVYGFSGTNTCDQTPTDIPQQTTTMFLS